jgi:metal-responsive CopG/Arc/MetJ family transcriptional regulator
MLVNFDCPKEFLRKFDQWCRNHGYPRRAEALREAMRQLMSGEVFVGEEKSKET